MRGFLGRVVFWFLWRTAFEELMRSERGAVEQRARRMVFGTLFLGLIVSVVGFIPYLLWLVTGRGPYRWLGANRHMAITGRRRNPSFPEDVMVAIQSGWAFPAPPIPDQGR